MKRYLVLTLMILLVLSFATQMRAATKEKITVGVFPALDAAYAALLPAFNAKHPDIEVEIKTLGYGDHHTMLVTTLAAGSGAPDVSAVEIGYIARFVAAGGLADLLKPPFNAGRYEKSVAPYKWGQATTSDGRLVAFPVDIAPACAYYRRDIFAEEKTKIEDLKCMDDLFAFAKKVTKDTNGDGKVDRWFVADAADIYQMVMRSSPYLYFDEKGNCLVETDRFLQAFTWAKRFRDAGLDAKIGAWTNEWYAAFQQGSVAYQPSGAWLGGHLKNWMAPATAGKWGVADFPALERGGQPMYANWGGSFLAIPEQSKKKEAAWKFIEFACTDVDAQLKSFEVADAFPSWMPAWDSDIMKESMDFFAGQKARLLWIEEAKRIPVVKVTKYDLIAQDIILAALTNVLENKEDPKAAIAQAKKDIERQTKR